MISDTQGPQYTATFIQQSIDGLLQSSRAFGLDLNDALMRALAALESVPCRSLDDALAFIAIGSAIREECFRIMADPARLYDANQVCDWYTAIGVNYLEGMRAKVPRPVHASHHTMH